jgi:hypothetical protein
LKVVIKYFAFFNEICKDSIISECVGLFSLVSHSQKFQNTAATKKFSLIEALSGFFEKESSSEDEQLIMAPLLPQKISNAHLQNFLSLYSDQKNILASALGFTQYISIEDCIKLLKILTKEIAFIEPNEKNFQIIVFLVHFGVKLINSSSEISSALIKFYMEFLVSAYKYFRPTDTAQNDSADA